MNESKSAPGLLGREISRKTIFILLLCALALLLLPMLLIAAYDIPSADDFTNGYAVSRAVAEEGGLSAVLSAAAEHVVYGYTSWQGTFSAVFLMALQPAAFGEQFYFLTAYIMLASLLSGIFFFCYTLFGKLFGADKYYCGIIAAATAILCTQFLPSSSQAFYWYVGAVYYTFYFGVSLIVYSLIVRYVLGEKRRVGMAAGIVLLLVFIGGGNYVTALLTAELLIAAAALLALLKNVRWKDVLIFFTVFMAAFLINALAPGNSARQSTLTERLGIAATLLNCFKAAGMFIFQWSPLPVLAILFFLTPVSAGICRQMKFRFRYPVLVSLFSFCLLASMFCPAIYAMGIAAVKPSGRIGDIIFFAYIILAVFNLLYWTGWVLQRHEKVQRETNSIRLWVLAAVLLLFIGGTALVVRRQIVTSIYASVSLYNGGARSYYETFQERLAVLKDDSVRDVEFEPFEYVPFVIFFSDVTEDADDWKNIAVMSYYNKDSVRLTAPFFDYWE